MLCVKRKIALIERKTGKRSEITNYDELIQTFYTDHADEYLSYSLKFEKILKKYEKAPLVKYKLTEHDKERLKEDPDYINLIPRYVVRGYDDAVGHKFDKTLKNEFYQGFLDGESKIIDFINNTNETYKAELRFIM